MTRPGAAYALSVDPRRRRLVWGTRWSERLAALVALGSLTGALAPALLPGSGVVVDAAGWVPAGLLWGLSALALGWRDRWVFEASGHFHRDRGWAWLVHRTSRPLAGFQGWQTQVLPGPRSPRMALTFRTAEGEWRLGAFSADSVEKARPALDLWSSWLAEEETHEP